MQDITTALAQLGAAGLIGWMWLTERRAGALRDRQLCESHDRLMQERIGVDVLVRVIEQNAKALATLESTQQRLTGVLDAMRVRQVEV